MDEEKRYDTQSYADTSIIFVETNRCLYMLLYISLVTQGRHCKAKLFEKFHALTLSNDVCL